MPDFSEDVMREIQERGITPRPFWYFLIRRSVFWTLAVFSILVGALALSIAHYVFFDNEGMSPAALIESPLESLFQGAPLAWLVLFGLFVISAYLSLKKTRTGYRYRTTTAIGGVAAITILLGVLLIALDFGHAVYYYLTHTTSFYEALKQSSDDIEVPF